MTRARRVRDLVLGMGTWRWRTTTALPAGEVERIIAIWAFWLGGALTGNPFTQDLWTRSPQIRLAGWVLTVVLACLAFRLGTELLRRSDRKDFGYWLSLSVQAHQMGAWRRWRKAS
jgi:hypothetical protein